MKRPNKFWQRIPVVVLFLAITIVGCADQNVPSQAQMMIMDVEPGANGEEKIVNEPISLPSEPLLFKMAKDSPPAAMLGDNDTSAQWMILSQPSGTAATPQPIPLPSEPVPQ